MQKGYGWGDALIEGASAADRSMNAKAEREAAKQRGILTEQQVKAATAENAERERKLGMEAGRRDAVSAPDASQVGTDGQPMAPATGPDGKPAAPKELKPFEIYSRAAKRRFDAGDIEGYEQFTNKSAALKTQYYTQALEESYRKNDLAGGLALLNDFPDGVKYDIRPGENGALLGVAVGPDGKERTMPFVSEKEAWSFISSRAKPGDIFGQLRQQAKDEIEAKKIQSEIDENKAQTGQATATAERTTVLADQERTFGPREAQARLGLIGAQTNAAGRSNDNTPANLRNIDGLVERGISRPDAVSLVFPKASGTDPSAPVTLAAQKELISAYTDPQKRYQLNASQVRLAEEILSGQAPKLGFRPGPRPDGAAGAQGVVQRPPLSAFSRP